ncbi:MAG: YraN family protein, partial [Clostridia bacterium]|nr:YraN family protein [Clostridia bacterium]
MQTFKGIKQVSGEQVMLNTKILGEKYENMAIHYLKQQKYKILARNFLCPAGEIDIVAY